MVLEPLRGAELEATSRKHGVTAATLMRWRYAYPAADEAGLKSRLAEAVDEETQTLKSAVTGLVMDNELSRERIKIRQVIAASPLSGEGRRNIRARPSMAGVRPSKVRLPRLMRAAVLPSNRPRDYGMLLVSEKPGSVRGV